MRAIGLDIHRGFCEVAIAEDGRVRPARRVGTAPAELEAFAASLAPADVVALEATGNAAAIARILAPHARVVLANPKATKAATRLRAKTDRIDARTLAQLLASGFLPEVWMPDQATATLRREVSRRAHLVKQRTKAKNQVHAALIRNLIGRPPASDLFGRRGRTWLAGIDLPADEREGVEASLRVIDFLDAEVTRLDAILAAAVLASPDMRRLMTLPGVSATTAATLAAVIGDVRRFPAPGRPAGRRAHSVPSPSGSPPGAAGTWPSSPSPASSPSSPRTCSAGRRNTRTAGRRATAPSSARSSSGPAPSEPRAGPSGSLARTPNGASSGSAPSKPRPRTDGWSPSDPSVEAVRATQLGRASFDAERQPARQGSAPNPALRLGDRPHRHDYALSSQPPASDLTFIRRRTRSRGAPTLEAVPRHAVP